MSGPLEIAPQTRAVGAIVTGLDLREPLPAPSFDALQRAFLQHHVLCLRGQQIGPSEQLAFAARWGRIFVHPYVPSIEGHPGVMLVSDPHPITVTWHQDTTHSKTPPKMSLLLAREVPSCGGDTLFANQHLAYEGLSAGLRRTLCGLRAVHKGTELAREKGMQPEEVSAVHPVVRTHPETGRKGLFVNADYTRALRGLERSREPPAARLPLRRGVSNGIQLAPPLAAGRPRALGQPQRATPRRRGRREGRADAAPRHDRGRRAGLAMAQVPNRAPEARADASPRVAPQALREHCAAVLGALGVPHTDAELVAESLVEADLRGVDSHGVHLLPMYVTRLRAGHVNARAGLRVIADEGPIARLDGGLGLGQVAGVAAMDLAVDKALRNGIGAVAVRESTHLGALAFYTLRAARRGVFAMAFQNGPTVVPPFGSVTPLFSTNPYSYAVPAGEEEPVVFDAATTAVAGNKILLARVRGDGAIPADWACDERGLPTTDPRAASIERLQWSGGHKGFGLAFLVEVLAGVLAGSCFGRSELTESPLCGRERVAKGYLFLALDVSRFLPLAEFRARVDALVRDVRSCAPAEGVERVLVPGELEARRRAERLRSGVPLSSALLEQLDAIGRELGVPPLERQAGS